MYSNVALSFVLGVFFVSAREIEELFSLIDDDYLRELVKNAELEVEKLREIESKAKYLNPYIISAEGRHQLKTCPAYKRNDVQTMFEIMTRDIVDRYKLDPADINLLRQYPLKSNKITEQLQEQCVDSRPVECINVNYPTIDGSCNHLDRPNEGRTFSCFDRLLPPDYADGVSSPMTCKECPLPDPRTITLKIHRVEDRGKLSSTYTAMFSGFGQFLDHDMVFTAQPESDTLTTIECCEGPPFHETCFPFKIPPDDPDFPGISCMNFVRDAQCTTCNLGWREQMNSLTPALDCSQVYGTELNQSLILRRLDGSGKLASRMTAIGELPLVDPDPLNQCKPTNNCLKTGDFRSSQNPLLTSLHIIFLRLHNRIVEILKEMNPKWHEEILYQEARKIVICMFQQIVYSEFLPEVIGPDYTLLSRFNEEYTEYDPSVPMKMYNEFVAAAYRLHSIVPDPIFLVTEDGTTEKVLLRDFFLNTKLVLERGIEDIIRGATKQPQENYDRLLVQSLTTHLYSANGSTLGLDLASINIQRGRDHGLRPYTEYVLHLHGCKIKKFKDLTTCGLMDKSTVEKLKKVYQCVECIDLFTGISSEKRLENAVVGPTAAMIISLQFDRLKFGSRHFCGHKGCLKSVEKKALIREVTFSRILCYVTNISEINEHAFIRGSRTIPCSYFPAMDLSAWKED